MHIINVTKFIGSTTLFCWVVECSLLGVLFIAYISVFSTLDVQNNNLQIVLTLVVVFDNLYIQVLFTHIAKCVPLNMKLCVHVRTNLIHNVHTLWCPFNCKLCDYFEWFIHDFDVLNVWFPHKLKDWELTRWHYDLLVYLSVWVRICICASVLFDN